MSEIMYERGRLLLSTAAWVGGLAGVVATQSGVRFRWPLGGCPIIVSR